jgi:hypothetical protein
MDACLEATPPETEVEGRAACLAPLTIHADGGDVADSPRWPLTASPRSDRSIREPFVRRVRSTPLPVMAPDSSPAAVKRWTGLIRSGSYNAVRAAIREGWAPVNAVDETGYTALMRCCVSGHLLDLLISIRDCDVNVSSAVDGSTALLLAARHRSLRAVHALQHRGAILSRDTGGNSVLHKAAANPDPSVMQLLLQSRADPCARDREGRCPLAAALLHGNEAAALVLLSWQQSWAERMLLHAFAEGRQAGQEGLVSEQAKRVGASRLESLPDDCIELILNLSAECSAVQGSISSSVLGSSVLHSPVDLALEGAPPGSTNGNCAFPQRISHDGGARADAVARVACVSKRFRTVCQRRSISAWVSVAGVNAPVTCYHPRGQTTTLLHLAVGQGMETVVDILLQRGARATALDSTGRTLLQAAGGRAALVAKLASAQAKERINEMQIAAVCVTKEGM